MGIRKLLWITAALVLTPSLGGALTLPQDYWVNPDTGNNANSGQADLPFQTVSWALAQPLSPGSTIYLQGTSIRNYSYTAFESFPWVLPEDVSIKADLNYPGAWIVEPGSNAAIQYLDQISFRHSTLEGLSFHCLGLGVPGRGVIEILPGPGDIHEPVIQNCEFHDYVNSAIKLAPLGGCTASPKILGNVFSQTLALGNNTEKTIWVDFTVGSMKSALEISNNSFEGNGIGNRDTFLLEGSMNLGKVDILNNTLLDPHRGLWLFGWHGGEIHIEENIIQYSQVGGGTCGLTIENQISSYWHENSTVKGNQFLGCGNAIEVLGTHDVVLEGNTGLDNTHGIIVAGAWYGADRVKILNNDFGVAGLYGGGTVEYAVWAGHNCTGVVIEGNTFTGGTSHGIQLHGHEEAVIRGNTIENFNLHGVYLENYFGGPHDTLVTGNRILGCQGSGIEIENGSHRVVLSRNWLEGNGQGIQDHHCWDTQIHDNVAVLNAGHGIWLNHAIDPAGNLVFTHNTCMDNGGNGLQSSIQSTAGAYIASGIFFGNNGVDVAGVSDHQIWHSCTGTNFFPPGQGNIQANPLVQGDYSLSLGSPCIDGGNETAWLSVADIAGKPRVQDGHWLGTVVPDMGAYEFNQTDLTVSGPFGIGDMISGVVQTVAGAQVGVYATASPQGSPILSAPGPVHPIFGNSILDPDLLVGGPVASGIADPSGAFPFTLNLPNNPALQGWSVALQASALDLSLGMGQASNAEVFVIQ
ncbi:MAG: right-handed parallel beta-helix repeat-containing protein [Planctomycetota bacterium]|nr:MAG: right-handed parallel beta-helix repeat-containing protein [Planctomycetota bacterium]